MNETALVIIKPDGMKESVIGNVFTKLSSAKLEMLGLKIIKPTKAVAEKHYKNIKGQPFFEKTIDYFTGKYHKHKQLIAIIYHGENAIKKLRKIAGETNPEDAAPNTLRGAFGRVTTTGIFENVVHVSSNKKEAKREIQLWFSPDEIICKLFPTKINKSKKTNTRVWA